MPVPTEARATLDTLSDGLTPEQYREVIWFLREPVKIRSRGNWPMRRAIHLSIVPNQA